MKTTSSILTLIFYFLFCSAFGQKSKCDSIARENDKATGKVNAHKFYSQDFPTGRWVSYDTLTCRITQIDTFINGKLNGISIRYMPDGSVMRKYCYANDTLNGPAYAIEVVGLDSLKIYDQYKHGKRNGESLVYDFKGNLYIKSNYVNGVWDGDCYIYYKSGRVRMKKVYDNGDVILTQIFKDDESNSLESQKIGKENNYQGEGYHDECPPSLGIRCFEK